MSYVPASRLLGGFGDFSFKAAIADAFADGSLNKLNAAISKLQSSLSGAYGKLDGLEKQKKALDLTSTEIDSMIDMGGGIRVPSEAGVALAEGYEALSDGYKDLVAFHFTTEAVVETLQQSYEVREIYSGIDGLINSFRNWKDTVERRVFPLGYTKTFYDQLQGAKWGQWVALTGRTGGYDYSDVRYMQATQRAAEAATGIEGSPEAAGLGEPLSGTIIAILAICSAIVMIAAVVAVTKVVDGMNYKAKALHESRMAYEAQKAADRQKYIDGRVAEGASVQQANAEWAGIEAERDKKQKEHEEELRKTPTAFEGFGDLAKVAMLGIGAFLVIQLVPTLTGRR